MTQSRPFLEAPSSLKNRVCDRLWQILSSPEPYGEYESFEEGERARILAILRETQSDLPETWASDRPLASAERSILE